MPAASHVEGEQAGEVDPVEAPGLDVGVRHVAAEEYLGREQRDGDREVLHELSLARRRVEVVDRERRLAGVLAVVPTPEVQSGDESDPRDEQGHRDAAPEHRVGRDLVADPGVVGPVVRVGVVQAGAIRGADPGRPPEVV